MNKHIQFTLEKEENGTLPFLDVHLSRNTDGMMEISVYHKQTHTDRYFDFLSRHLLPHKKSEVTSLLLRAKALSSTAAECTKEELHITGALKGNGYPTSFVRRSVPPLTLTPTREIADTQAKKQTMVCSGFVRTDQENSGAAERDREDEARHHST